MIASVEQPDGKMIDMMLPATGGTGRVLLGPNERSAAWSNDGAFEVFGIGVDGGNDLGLLSLANGTRRRLTTTPESEAGTEFTPDGKSIVYRRAVEVGRLFTVDLAGWMKK